MQRSKNDANRSIECTVDQCKYHYKKDDYCTLDSILIGTHEPNPTVPECTDCRSFEAQTR